MGLRTWIYKKWGIKLRKFDTINQINTVRPQEIQTKVHENYTTEPALDSEGGLMGFIGRDLEKALPEKNISVSLLSKEQKQPWRVICFYTQDNEYAEIIKKLEASLNKFNIDHQLVPIKSVGAWGHGS